MAKGNATVVVIAHRLSTIKNADMIAVVEKGKVAETGTHDELIAKQGKYYSLVEAQKGKFSRSESSVSVATTDTETSDSNPPSRSNSEVGLVDMEIETVSIKDEKKEMKAKKGKESKKSKKSKDDNDSAKGSKKGKGSKKKKESKSDKDLKKELKREDSSKKSAKKDDDSKKNIKKSKKNTKKSSDAIIDIHNVHFTYPSRPDNKIFRGLGFQIKEGETVAIVGPSGQGKSTIIQLIEEFYRPSKGRLEYNGDDIKDLNVRWYRNE